MSGKKAKRRRRKRVSHSPSQKKSQCLTSRFLMLTVLILVTGAIWFVHTQNQDTSLQPVRPGIQNGLKKIDFNGPPEQVQIEVNQKLYRLLQDHPDPIVQRMYQDILNREMGFVLDGQLLDKMDLGAIFSAIPWEGDTTRFRPHIIVHPDVFGSITTSNYGSVLDFWRVVSHEATHYVQFMDALDEGRIDDAMTFVRGGKGKNVSCEYMWQCELEAYQNECRQALSWGLEDSLMCDCVDDEKRFSRYIFKSMEPSMRRNKHSCLEVWRKLSR